MIFYETNLHSQDYNDTPTRNKGEVHIQLASSDIIIVPTWRHTLAMPLAIGHKLEVMDCIARHNNFHNNIMLHVDSAFKPVVISRF